MNRRNFLQSMLATGATFAIARSGVLMPVKQIVIPSRIHEADLLGAVELQHPWYATGIYLDRWAGMYGLKRDWFPAAETDASLRNRVTDEIHQRMAFASGFPKHYLTGEAS